MGKSERIEAEKLGGSDKEDWFEYQIPDERAYFDKRNHLERSMRHQPNHIKVAKKKELLAVDVVF